MVNTMEDIYNEAMRLIRLGYKEDEAWAKAYVRYMPAFLQEQAF